MTLHSGIEVDELRGNLKALKETVRELRKAVEPLVNHNEQAIQRMRAGLTPADYNPELTKRAREALNNAK